MQLNSAIRSSSGRGNGSAFNALKHGVYAESILLPGDDVAEFRRQRRSLFHNYRPQTQDEADLVEAMAEHRWVARRFRAVQAQFDGQAVTPATDGAGQIGEPIAHQRLHSGMDVTVHRNRIENLWHRARAKLVEQQKLRRQGLIAGAVALPQDCYMETDGRVFGPVAPKVIVPIPEPDIENVEADRMEVRPSTDGGNGKSWEQKETERAAVRPDGSRGRWTGRFGAPGEFAEASGTAAGGVWIWRWVRLNSKKGPWGPLAVRGSLSFLCALCAFAPGQQFAAPVVSDRKTR